MNNYVQNIPRLFRLISIALVTLLFTSSYPPTNVSAQSGGLFPGEPFNGLQIEYSISGANLGSPQDQEGFTWSRNYDGTLSGNKLVVSGVAHASAGWGATLVVQLSSDGADPVEYTASKFPENGLFPDPMEEPFSLSIDIPRGAESASFSISLTGDYNAGSRGVVVSGNLAGVGSGASQGQDDSSGGGVPIGLIIGGVATAAVVVTGSALVVGGAVAINRARRQAKPKASAKPQPPATGDPEVDRAVRGWEQVARQAELEAEKYRQLWKEIQATSDPNDPEYQTLQQQYQDYIDYKRNEAVEARRKMQEILQQEQQYQQEQRQQEAYRQHRQAEREFIERESQRQARRQGAFDRQLDQSWEARRQKLEQLKTERKQYRDNLQKELIKARQAVDLATANQEIAAGVIPGVFETTAEWVQWGADTAIDVIAQVAPGTKPVKTGYLYFRGLASGAGEAWADKANWKSHLAMGFKKGTVDATVYIIKDKPLDYVPVRVKNFVKPKWVNLPENTNVMNVTGGQWLRGGGQALISKVRSKLNPIVHGGKYLNGLKF